MLVQIDHLNGLRVFFHTGFARMDAKDGKPVLETDLDGQWIGYKDLFKVRVFADQGKLLWEWRAS